MNDQVAQAERLLAERDLPGAIVLFEQARPLEPDRADSGLWQCAMLAGDFATAWAASDRIHARGGEDPHRFWDGQPLAGKRVIVRSLHGFGDAVQFLRYLPMLQGIAASVTLEVAPRLVKLARCLQGADHVITWGDKAPATPPEWETQIEVMELPYCFRTQAADLPLYERYLHVPQGKPLPASRSLRVGVAWSAGEWNLERALPIEHLCTLLSAHGCEFWSLGTRVPPVAMHEAPGTREDLVSLAQLVAQVDLVITVDTFAAHLAGALGVRTWLLLQHVADWRWQHERADSPWYPTLRIFRQPAHGDWANVVQSVLDALLEIRA